MAEGEVKRSGTAYRLDSTRVRRSAFRSLVSFRTRWRIYPFPRRMNSCSFVSKIWGNGVDVVRLAKLNESEKQDNTEFIYIFLFAEAHIYTVVNSKWFTNCIRLYINIILRLFKVSTRAKWPHHSDIVYTSIFLYERRINKLHCFPSATQYRKLQNLRKLRRSDSARSFLSYREIATHRISGVHRAPFTFASHCRRTADADLHSWNLFSGGVQELNDLAQPVKRESERKRERRRGCRSRASRAWARSLIGR